MIKQGFKLRSPAAKQNLLITWNLHHKVPDASFTLPRQLPCRHDLSHSIVKSDLSDTHPSPKYLSFKYQVV